MSVEHDTIGPYRVTVYGLWAHRDGRKWGWAVTDQRVRDFDKTVACGASVTPDVAWKCARDTAQLYVGEESHPAPPSRARAEDEPR